MTVFWLLTALLVIAGLVIVALPLISKHRHNDEVLRDELNKAFFKNRLKELEEEVDEGLVENQQELIDDLKQSLLDDIPAHKQVQAGRVSALKIFIPSALLVTGLSYAMYFQFGAYQEVQDWQKISAELPALSKKLMSPEARNMTEQELTDLSLALRTQLHKKPDDAAGWLLLGRLSMATRDLNTAIDSMARAYKLDGGNEDIQLGYAQALMSSRDEADQTLARQLLQRLAMKETPDIRVMSLLAFDAFERQDFKLAIRYWSSMQQMIGEDDPRFDMLTQSIASAERNLNKEVQSANGKAVPVTINLGANAQPDPSAIVIVSVHTADGAPMPVAAARYQMGDFPLNVELDDSNSMVQGRKISDLEQLIVKVRLDSDGNVMTKTGDWFGESEVVKLGEPVEILIDSQY
ncbi:c-type cytochrome biogenesis protein CcmI [Vibrio sp.]|uniref:c-type cytochrome biogenesis protein CcmI n=1 Tax=Vibrio sp. TaxID=678 RepID=UPI003D14DFBE